MTYFIKHFLFLFSVVIIESITPRVFAQVKREFINAPALPPVAPSYTQAVAVTGGRTIYLSGHVSSNAKGEIIGRGRFRKQVETIFENLKITLAAAGADFTDIVKINYYVVKSTDLALLDVRKVRSLYLGSHAPASTYISVEGLYVREALIEIEVIAVTGSR